MRKYLVAWGQDGLLLNIDKKITFPDTAAYLKQPKETI